jgi:WD40 repeat protein
VLASGASDNTIMLWDILTGERLQALLGHDRVVFSVAFPPMV